MVLLLKGGTIIYKDKVEIKDIIIEDNIITWTGNGYPEDKKIDKEIDCEGKLILPGNVNGHGHIYSALARGMPAPPQPPYNFYEILKYIWWRLDKALDEESLYYSALVAAVEAIKSGTTSIIDHHASPDFIDGSLDVIEKALVETGLRGILCYEVTDRNGKKGAMEGVKENERFIKKTEKEGVLVKGMVGGHASFTMDDDTLDACHEVINRYNVGFHIHVAEDQIDRDDSYSRFGISVAERLIKHNLLNDKSIIAHGVHLNKEERKALSETGCYLAHNPRSNMNNGVGYSRPYEWKGKVIIGTDGIGSDMFTESLFAYFKVKDSGAGILPETIIEWLWNSSEILEKYWNRPFGKIEEGAMADLIILDYNPPTPLDIGTLPWHWMFGLSSNYVNTVIINGKIIMEEREILTVDEEEIFYKSREVTKRLWSRM